jgi:small subunit ribosomal protein S16
VRLFEVRALPGSGRSQLRSTNNVIKLRLRRMGAKKRPSYRIVAADSRSPRDGRVIESLGYYDPLTEPATVKVNEDRVRHWLSVGAQPSDTVRDLLRRQGLVPDDPARAGGKATPA